MSNISWMYRNKCLSASIIDINGTSNTSDYGSSFAIDNNLQTEWRSNSSLGVGTFLFDFGSALYIDSLIVVHNLSSTGTLYFNVGDTNPPITDKYGLPLLGNTGTSMRFLSSPVNYRYWQLILNGTTAGNFLKLKETFIGKRDELPINPEWPFLIESDTKTIITQSETGHKYVYRKYDSKKFSFKYNGINQAEFGTLNNMRSLCSGAYVPFFMCIDKDDNKFDTKFVRFSKGSWKSSEVAYKIYDLEFSVEEGF